MDSGPLREVALPPDLREALETVRSGIKSCPCYDEDQSGDDMTPCHVALALIESHLRESEAKLTACEQRLVEYERVVEAARFRYIDGQGPLAEALAALDSPKEKP